MKTQSAKAKGRRLQQTLRDKIISELGVDPEDLESRPMGSQGEDIILSKAARQLFPFSPECKNQEKINIFMSWDQAEMNAPEDVEPVLVFKKNKTAVFAMIKLDCLLKMQQKINIYKKVTGDS